MQSYQQLSIKSNPMVNLVNLGLEGAWDVIKSHINS